MDAHVAAARREGARRLHWHEDGLAGGVGGMMKGMTSFERSAVAAGSILSVQLAGSISCGGGGRLSSS